MSIGEEQSEGYCTAIAWSPPGLGRHRRCVLAVLTSNHVLSIWECVGKSANAEDWKRVSVVNHALQTMFASQDGDVELQNTSAGQEAIDLERKKTEAAKTEKHKVRQRIRSFAWSHVPPSASTTGYAGATSPLSQPYLAVSNDIGEVFVLKVRTPYDLFAVGDTRWNTSVIHSFTPQVKPGKRSALAACMPITFQKSKVFVDQLAWSPWSRDATGTLSSVLAMTIQSTLQCRVIRANITTDDTIIGLGPTLPQIVDDKVATPAGQMQWLPKLSADGEMYLLYPCRKTLYCLVFHLRKSSGTRVTKQLLNNVWDEISGQSSSMSGQSQPIDFRSQAWLSQMTSATDLSFRSLTTSTLPALNLWAGLYRLMTHS